MAQHFQIAPDRLTNEQIHEYFVFLVKEKRFSQGYFKMTRAAVAFFYKRVCPQAIEEMATWKPPRRTTIPEVMSPDEVCLALTRVRDPTAGVCLLTMYGCGLRAGEAVGLETVDIDAEREVIHLRRAKGGKQRLVPLGPVLLDVLRRHWVTHRHPRLLFPGPDRSRSIRVERLSRIFQAAAAEAGVRRHVTLHTLRHSYATHLHEAGHDLRVIQHLLGHASPVTTAIYAHITRRGLQAPLRTADALVERIVGASRG